MMQEVPVLIQDACGAGNAEAADRSRATLHYPGKVSFCDGATFRAALPALGWRTAPEAGRVTPEVARFASDEAIASE